MSAAVQYRGAAFRRKLFLEKEDYQTCHICLPETQERVAAIATGQTFYSFFKTIQDRDKALDVLARLYDSGHDAVITQTPKAYALWILEEGAVPIGAKRKHSVPAQDGV